ncbi:PREDICTED: uncharacterized protein LOC106786123 isoform X1 [Polistes canadensis]|uniref:uncharacterized protein LOC106786123 isoform X1 n=2 Tax=Polistes canadensis TaxID=91411 RepID=UPI000718EFE8|nr:PREDICTED: uncharacterized protein LOC106786123 isoform X1 [Polistes canadensis]
MLFTKMTGSTKRKLAIFIGTSKCLIYAEAKYCASEMPEQRKYYECSRSEYCCAFGCCVSPGLHFHHLWYYWILVIIMFLVCSGGGWWYRYRLQGRYRAAASAIPSRPSNSRTQNTLRGQTCQPQQARISYNSARNTVLLHRMWKGPQRNGTSLNFNGNATTSTHYQNMNVVLNDANCPYYQLYGPPPSYETVIAETRGKTLSSPTSSEVGAARLNLEAESNVITNPSVPSYFAYPCSPARLNPVLMNSDSRSQQSMQQCVNGPVNSQPSNAEDCTQENAAYVRFPSYCQAENAVGSPAAIARQNYCVSPLRQERSSATLSPIDTFEFPPIVHNIPRRGNTLKPEVDSSNSRERKVLRDVCKDVEYTVSQVRGHMKLEKCPSNDRYGKYRQQVWKENMKHDDVDEFFSVVHSSTTEKPDEIEVGRNSSGGLFKVVGKYASGSKHDEEQQNEEERREEDDDEEEARDYLGSQERIFVRTTFALSENAKRKYNFVKRVLTDVATSPQSNPSNNVIAGSFVSAATRTNADSDVESKRRLDRSKSLD